jgi:hypothetical protein
MKICRRLKPAPDNLTKQLIGTTESRAPTRNEFKLSFSAAWEAALLELA